MKVFEFIVALALLWSMWLPVPAWLTLQIAALAKLRGVAQVLCAVPIPFMAWVAQVTYSNYRADSNLWPIWLILSAPAALAWVAACVWLSPSELALKRGRTKLAGIATAGLMALSVPISLITGVQASNARKRQSQEADAIIAAIGARVLVGTVHGEGVEPALLRSVEARIKAENYVYQSCYEHGVRVEPGTSGSALLSLSIQADGTVTSATVVRSSGTAAAERCILRTLRGLRFDARADAQETVITIPMLLEQT